MKILKGMYLLVGGLLLVEGSAYAHDLSNSYPDRLIEHINKITISMSVEKREGSPEAFKQLCRAMLSWFEHNRNRFGENSKDEGIGLSQEVSDELARQIVKQGIDNFDGNLSIDFAGLDQ